MSDIDSARRTKLSVSINNVDISTSINDHLLTATFTDLEDGSADDMEITLEDRDNEIVSGWLSTELNKRGESAYVYTCPYSEPSDTLKKGDDGTGVKWLQWHLNKVNGAGLSVNGTFGTKTRTAVKKYQKKKGVKQTGQVNSTLRAKLKADLEATNATTKTAQKTARMSVSIKQTNTNSDGKDLRLNCGSFELDEVAIKGPPQVVTLRGTALPYGSALRKTKKTRAWENTTLFGIAKAIAKIADYSVLYLTDKTVKYTRKQQSSQTYITFLQSLCTAAGLSLKVTSSTLVIFDQSEYESKTTTRTIKRGDGSYSSYSFKTSLSDTSYSCCHVSWTTSTGKVIEYTYTPSGFTKDEDNMLEVTDEPVTTVAEAKTLAKARLREANKGETEGSFTMPGDLTLCAGLTVEISGYGDYDGKYIIEQAKHTIGKSGGFKTTIDLRQVITGY
ncbi:MAG: peptidoglycan-binding protein [Clostridiales bacterium]|nr:peptidoglycan-binding protein [Clostridiales bacterium]